MISEEAALYLTPKKQKTRPRKITKPKGKPEADWSAEKFWTVQLYKRGIPSFRHPTLASAFAEAKRLSEHTKLKAYVFEVIGTIDPPSV
jgi:hypothetical protein